MSIYQNVTKEDLPNLSKLAKEQEKNQRANKTKNRVSRQTHDKKLAESLSPITKDLSLEIYLSVMQRYIFYSPRAYEKVPSTKSCWLISLNAPSETGETHFIYNCLKIGTFQSKFDKTKFFIYKKSHFMMLC